MFTWSSFSYFRVMMGIEVLIPPQPGTFQYHQPTFLLVAPSGIIRIRPVIKLPAWGTGKENKQNNYNYP